MGRLIDIQTAPKPFLKIGIKLKYIFMIISGLAESFKTSIAHRTKNPLRKTSENVAIIHFQDLYIIRMVQE